MWLFIILIARHHLTFTNGICEFCTPWFTFFCRTLFLHDCTHCGEWRCELPPPLREVAGSVPKANAWNWLYFFLHVCFVCLIFLISNLRRIKFSVVSAPKSDKNTRTTHQYRVGGQYFQSENYATHAEISSAPIWEPMRHPVDGERP